MTAAWKAGIGTFVSIMLVGLIVRAAGLWILRQSEAGFGDLESLGIIVMRAEHGQAILDRLHRLRTTDRMPGSTSTMK